MGWVTTIPVTTVFPPSLEGFTEWLYPATGIPEAVLPPDSIYITYAYIAAVTTVNLQLTAAIGPAFMLAVYNLGADFIFNYAPDVNQIPYPEKNPDGLYYFAYLRKQWNLNGFVGGVISASQDQTTSQSMDVPKQFDTLTISDLQHLKTPWGQAYLAIAQKVGMLWGIS
jgi:hypothetical protein